VRNRSFTLLILCVAAGAGIIAVLAATRTARVTLGPWLEADRPVGIRPDYSAVVVPPNIAPLNFAIEEPGSAYVVRIRSTRGEAIEVTGRSSAITIPPEPWRRLLNANRGEDLYFEVYVRGDDAQWRRFQTVTNRIAREDIDAYLVYRKIKPLYNFWGPVGIYERNIETYDERVILHNDTFDPVHRGCPNCHTFQANQPDTMVMHVRGPSGGMLTLQGGQLVKIDTRTKRNPRPAAFASWHPSGTLIAFSMNSVRQGFHSSRPEVRDAYDMDSDMAIYLFDSQTLVSPPAIRRPDRLETFPAWSPDGKSLYFCSAPKLWTDNKTQPPVRYAEVRYDLMRIGYDVETGRWGEIETVLASKTTGQSITQPKVSPDGRFVLFCMSDYSQQPSFQPNADLWLLDIETGEHRRLACNSESSESWHAWSSNGRWIVFSSKRGDGQFIRPYFSYVDAKGTAHKALVLPQEDPRFYDSCIMLYQLPELVCGPIPLTQQEVLDVVRSSDAVRSDVVTGASPVANTSRPADVE
jgi:WD40-like Beta Propeller Repeat